MEVEGIDYEEYFKGFSKLTRKERFTRLIMMGVLKKEDVAAIQKTNCIFENDLAEKFIENSLGYFMLPIGVATNFNINGKDVVIPMAVEETSIIAAASKTARWVRKHGSIKTEMVGNEIIGQMQFSDIKNEETFIDLIEKNKLSLIEKANKKVAFGLVNRGGGVRDIQCRKIVPDSTLEGGDPHSSFVVLHVLMNACDAMGANIVNQVCEFLKTPIFELTNQEASMCILSNLTDTRLTKATIELDGLDEELVEKIEKASYFAERDPYRAATHNKGVMNGVDPIIIATGNDWRAVEAAVHAYAAQSDQYRVVTRWRKVGKNGLRGEFLAPIPVGTVGGVTNLHPYAQTALRMMGIKKADELSQICAAVGLVQNLGALKALTTVGIIEGHMKLHIKNLTLSAGASEEEVPAVQKKLEEILRLTKRISLSNAKDVLSEIRGSNRVRPIENRI